METEIVFKFRRNSYDERVSGERYGTRIQTKLVGGGDLTKKISQERGRRNSEKLKLKVHSPIPQVMEETTLLYGW